MSVIILQDEIVHYEVLGRGRPLIFLHGWVGSWRYWIPAMQSASVSFRTYAIDLWGFGDTSKAPQYYTLEQQVTLIDQFMKRMGVGRIALIGHGLGAIVSMLFANSFKPAVDRVMLVSMPDSQHLLNPRFQAAPPAELAEWLLNRTAESEPTRSEALKADHRAIQSSLDGFQKLDFIGLYHNFQIPCLLVYGQNDPAVEEIDFAGQTVNFPENFHQIVFENSGHFPMLDEPSKFNRLLTDFLSLNSGDSPRQLQLKEEWKRRVR